MLKMARIEGNDICIEDFLQESRESESNIQRAYENTSILLIGATSFIGSVILEKILRSCPEVECIYVLIREKDGKTPDERMKVLFRKPIFDRLKMENAATLNKVQVIPCDLYESGLGVSNEDYQTLVSQVNSVIHAARVVGSNVRFREAALINLKALQNVLKLCHEMKKLDAVSYISSVFAHYNETVVEEKLYSCSISGDGLINMVDHFSEETLDAITPGIIGNYPNISFLTIAVAESILNECGQGLPLSIIRPPFVLASYNEPISGWIQPQRQESPTDILLNVFLGKIFTIHCDGERSSEVVPVDMVANLIITVHGQLLLKRKEWINQAIITLSNTKTSLDSKCDIQQFPIYNISPSDKQLTWSTFFRKSIEYEKEVPFLDTVWYSASLRMNKYWFVHWIISWMQFSQIILYDKFKGVLGVDSELLGNIKTVQNTSFEVSKFCEMKLTVKSKNMTDLWASLADADRSKFDFNVKSLDWNQFFYTQCRGLRVYLMNDPLSTVPDAQRNRKRMRATFKILISFIGIVFSYILYGILLRK